MPIHYKKTGLPVQALKSNLKSDREIKKIIIIFFHFSFKEKLCTVYSLQYIVSLTLKLLCYSITKTRLYNFDPIKPHFYIVKLGFTGVYIIFLISARKHSLWVLVRTASPR